MCQAMSHQENWLGCTELWRELGIKKIVSYLEEGAKPLRRTREMLCHYAGRKLDGPKPN